MSAQGRLLTGRLKLQCDFSANWSLSSGQSWSATGLGATTDRGWCTRDCGRKRTKTVEEVVLYGPVADSTAYSQVANINISDPLATTEADTVPRTRQVSSTQTEQLG